MARPNQERTIGSSRTLALRIAHEREAKGWTYEGLAARMASVGCPIRPSALHKIEKGKPPRRIDVDELVALANVLETSMEELLLPIRFIRDQRMGTLVEQWWLAREALAAAKSNLLKSETALRAYVKRFPDTAGGLSRALVAYLSTDGRRDPEEAEEIATALALLLARARVRLSAADQKALDSLGAGIDRWGAED